MTSNSPEQALFDQKCEACEGLSTRLDPQRIASSLSTLDDAWSIIEDHHLFRAFRFPDFKTALDFTNRIGRIAEDEGHHPDIALGWGKVEVTLWTHSVDGLTRNDFILASKISRAEQTTQQQRS